MSAFEPWVRDFLLAGTKTGALATVRADSSPHVKPVWFTLDGDVLVFNTHRDSVAGKALLRDQRVAIAVDEPVPPFSFVLLRGRVEISTDPAQLRLWSGRIGGRYMGAEREEEFAARNGVPGELLLRLAPERVVAARDIAE